MIKALILPAILFLFSGMLYSQIKSVEIGRVEFFPPKISSNIERDSKNATPFKFAELIEPKILIEEFGYFERDSEVQNLTCKAEGAKSLNALLKLESTDTEFEMYISDEENKVQFGPFSAEDFTSGNFATPLVPGETFRVSVYKLSANFPQIRIVQMGYDFIGIVSKDGQFGLSGECNVDINCEQGADWQTLKRSVVRLIVNNRYLCTGSFINNLRNDKRPYLLTARHCFGEEPGQDSLMAARTTAYFNYESPTCNGQDGPVSQVRTGFWVRAMKNDAVGKVDFALLELKTTLPSIFNTQFAGWDASGRIPANSVTIHHPRGDVKKISFDNQPPTRSSYPFAGGYDAGSFWKIGNWDLGTTEGGSSGSPLYDHNQNVIGVLTGGEASCEYNLSDYYTQLAYAWDTYPDSSQQLKYWLNPDNLPTRVCNIPHISDYPQARNKVNTLEVYPVPAVNQLSFNWNGLINKQLHTEIFDCAGRLVASFQQKTPPDGNIILTFTLSEGLYFLRTSDGDISGSTKFVVH